jgi:catechol 2,3-dioxygenase-like lactoylglutathione lyase family enzyme
MGADAVGSVSDHEVAADWQRLDLQVIGKAVGPGSDDLCFLTSSTPQQVVDHFKSCGVAIEEGPGEKSGAMGTIVSVYCRDPDGNLIEVSSYKQA